MQLLDEDYLFGKVILADILGSVLRRSATCQFLPAEHRRAKTRNSGIRIPVAQRHGCIRGGTRQPTAPAPAPDRASAQHKACWRVGSASQSRDMLSHGRPKLCNASTPFRAIRVDAVPYTHIAPSDLRMTGGRPLRFDGSSRTIGAAEWRAVVRHGLVSSPLD
jgi:hypothetical protein